MSTKTTIQTLFHAFDPNEPWAAASLFHFASQSLIKAKGFRACPKLKNTKDLFLLHSKASQIHDHPNDSLEEFQDEKHSAYSLDTCGLFFRLDPDPLQACDIYMKFKETEDYEAIIFGFEEENLYKNDEFIILKYRCHRNYDCCGMKSPIDPLHYTEQCQLLSVERLSSLQFVTHDSIKEHIRVIWRRLFNEAYSLREKTAKRASEVDKAVSTMLGYNRFL